MVRSQLPTTAKSWHLNGERLRVRKTRSYTRDKPYTPQYGGSTGGAHRRLSFRSSIEPWTGTSGVGCRRLGLFPFPPPSQVCRRLVMNLTSGQVGYTGSMQSRITLQPFVAVNAVLSEI